MTDQFQIQDIGLQQLWYTWSKEGLEGKDTFQIRAASDGLKNVRSPYVRSFRAYLSYDLPQGTDSYQATPTNSPICLIFADPHTGASNPENEQRNTHILVRKIYTGQDVYGRAGAYFAHLIDLSPIMPRDFVASDAISLWNAAFWQERDDLPGDVRLDILRSEELRPNETYRYPDLRNLKRENLEYVIQAYLSLRPEQKLYIAAPAEDVALLIWCLAHSLPRSLQQKQNLTFSTYEQEVTRAATRIAGTSRPTVARQHAMPPPLLPLENFSSSSGSALALDCYTGQCSPLPSDPDGKLADYAQSIVQQLLDGNKPLIDEMLKAASNAKVIDTKQLLKFFESYKGALQGLTLRDASALLDNATMAASLLHQPAVQQSLINLCITNPGWWKTEGQRRIMHLRAFNYPPGIKSAITDLGMAAANELATALVESKGEVGSVLMELLSVTAPVSTAEGGPAWLQLLMRLTELGAQERHFSPRRTFSWEMRFWLLVQWVPIKTQIDEEGQRRNQNLIYPWLRLNDWSELYQMVGSREHLPASWRELAVSNAIIRFAKEGQQPDRKLLLYWMKNDSKLFERALGALMQRAETLPAAGWYLGLLVAVDYEGYFDLLLSLLQISSQVPNQNIEGFLAALGIARQKKEQQILLEQYGKVLLAHQISPSIVQIIDSYLDSLSKKFDEKLAEAGTKQALRMLYEQRARLPEPLPIRVQHWYFASIVVLLKGARTGAELQIPLETEQVKGIAAAIVHFRLQEHEEFKDSLYEVLIYSISSSGKLNEVIHLLGPALDMELIEFWGRLMGTLGEMFQLGDDYRWFLPYLQLALQVASALSRAEQVKYLDALLPSLLYHVDKTTFEYIDASVHQRMDAAGVQLWESYRERVRPGSKMLKSMLHRIRPGKRQAVQQPFAQAGYQWPESGSSSRQGSGFAAKEVRNQQSDFQSHEQPDVAANQFMWNQSQQQQQQIILSPEVSPSARRIDQKTGQNQDTGQGDRSSKQARPAQQGAGMTQAEIDMVFPPYSFPAFKLQDWRPPQQPSQLAGGSAWQGGPAPIPDPQISKMDALKFLYLELRRPDLSNRITHLHKQSVNEQLERLKQRLNDELNELDAMLVYQRQSPESLSQTRCLLENDRIIQDALAASLDWQLRYSNVVKEVLAVRETPGYTEARRKYSAYTDEDIQAMLAIFTRQRVMESYLRDVRSPQSLKEWLRGERQKRGYPPDNAGSMKR